MKSWISENGGILAVLGVAVLVLAAYGEWRVGVAVDNALAEKNFPSDATIAEIKGKDDAQDVRMDGLEARQNFSEEQMRDMGRILMRQPEGQ